MGGGLSIRDSSSILSGWDTGVKGRRGWYSGLASRVGVVVVYIDARTKDDSLLTKSKYNNELEALKKDWTYHNMLYSAFPFESILSHRHESLWTILEHRREP
jgi:hypothetical protein